MIMKFLFNCCEEKLQGNFSVSQNISARITPHLLLMLRLIIYPSLSNIPILYPLKKTENQSFSDIFRGYKMGTLARNGLICF